MTGPKASGHLYGAAADLYRVEPDGTISEIFFNGDPEIKNPEDPENTQIPEWAQIARREFREPFLAQGFVGLPSEWWHFVYGDMVHATVTGRSETIYSPIGNPDSDPRAIRPVFEGHIVMNWSDEERALVMPALLSGSYLPKI